MLTAQNIQALALADKARAQTQTAGEQAVASKEADAFVASQSAATISETTSNSIWVNVSTFIRGVIRPLITSYLLAIATYFGYNVGLLVQGLKAFDNAALFTLYAQVINEVFFLTNLAVSWWFGARGSSPRNPFITSK